MLLIWSLVLVSVCLVKETTCVMEQIDLPPELFSCYQRFEMKSNITETVGESVHYFCTQQFLWKTERIRWTGFNITQKDMDFINSLLRRIIYRGPRSRRQAGMMPRPPTGFRIRQEYRRLTDGQRMAFHMAIRQMKQAGEYDTFANLHQGIVVQSAHGGPNFFGWHRIFLALFEEALRRYNRFVAIPYWDSTMDFDMADPAQSVIWTSRFLGNGNGVVNTGPFANFQTPSGPLTRNVGGTSRLLSKPVINTILTRCRTADISEPNAMNQFNLEFAHGGPHNWVGGQMSGLNTAAHDPVFFLHHAFVDYIWELFRTRQRFTCGVNPIMDYPQTTGLHAPQRAMDGLQNFRNIDGYANYWTTTWYNYERAPGCAWFFRNCGSPYLRCDITRQVCVSLTRAAVGEAQTPAVRASLAFGGRAQEAAINVGPRFRAPPSDGRTLDSAGGAMLMRAAATAPRGGPGRVRIGLLGNSIGPGSGNGMRTSNANLKDEIATAGVIGTNIGNGIGKTFRAPPSDGRTRDFKDPSSRPAVKAQLRNFKSQTMTGSGLGLPIQNTFFLNGVNDINKWAFVPVQVVHQRSPGDIFTSFPVQNGQTVRNTDMYCPSSYPNLKSHMNQGNTASYENCQTDPSGAGQVIVQSHGLNYMGTYSDYAILDSRLPVSSAMAYVGIKSPADGMAEVMFSAFDRCGRMCQARCMVQGVDPPVYQPCSGAMRVTSETPKMFGSNFGEAVMNIWNWKGNGAKSDASGIQLVFHCTSENVWPWAHCTPANKG